METYNAELISDFKIMFNGVLCDCVFNYKDRIYMIKYIYGWDADPQYIATFSSPLLDTPMFSVRPAERDRYYWIRKEEMNFEIVYENNKENDKKAITKLNEFLQTIETNG